MPGSLKSDSPFDLTSPDVYKRWRDFKLVHYPASVSQLIVEIKDPVSLTNAEKEKLSAIINKCNSVIYHSCKKDLTEADILALGKQVGLFRIDKNPLSGEDAVSSITDKTGSGELKAGEYIPYTNKAIQWHTDGYYNPPQEQIHGFILHCASEAAEGGENEFIDNEILYLLLREKNPEHIKTLMEPDAFIIPVNEDMELTLRPESVGPVFDSSPEYGLHTRYTARKRNIIWKESVKTALHEFEAILNAESKFHFRGKLLENQGIITNNSIHKRNSFTDSSSKIRKMFRARYYDRVKINP